MPEKRARLPVRYLKFYEDENTRHPELYGATVSEKWAKRALKALSKKYGLAGVKLVFGAEGEADTSLASTQGIFLAHNADWLTLAHEFGHVIEFRKHGNSYHAPRLRRIIDGVCAYITEMNWHNEDMIEQFDAFAAGVAALEGVAVAE